MYALDARAVHEDFERRTGLRQSRNPAGVELHRQPRPRRAAGVAQIVVGAQGCQHHGEEGAQDSILIGAGHGADRPAQLPLQLQAESSAGGRLRRMQARLEQQAQIGGSLRVCREHALHIALAERNSGLQQVAAAGPQHAHASGAELGADQQAVKAIVFKRAGAYGAEGGNQLLGHLCHRHRVVRIVFEFEVLHPGGLAVDRAQPIRALGDDAQSKMFEGWQHLGDGQCLAALDDAQVRSLRRLVRRLIETQLHALRSDIERFQVTDIIDRERGADILAIRGGEGGAVALIERPCLRIAVATAQGRQQMIAPRYQHGRNFRFQPCRLHHRCMRRIDAHHHVQLRQRRLAQCQARFEARGVKGVAQQLFDARLHRAVEALARQIDQTRPEAPEFVVPHDQAHLGAFVQHQHGAHAADQIRHAGLEHFITRQRLDCVRQPACVVAARCEMKMCGNAPPLQAQPRYLLRTGQIGTGGPQADDAGFADDAATGVKALDTDVVQITRAMHRRAPIRLGDEQDSRLTQRVADIGPQQPAFAIAALTIAQKSQRAARHRHQLRTGAAVPQAIFHVAEKGKMMRLHVQQQVAAFLDHIRRQRRRVLLQFIAEPDHRLAHASPIVVDAAHVRHRLQQAL